MSLSSHINSSTNDKTHILRYYIRKSINECTQRGLMNCSKWLGEQLVGLNSNNMKTTSSAEMMKKYNLIQQNELIDEEEDCDSFLFAKSLFDLKEYDRCAHVLQQESNKSKKLLFLQYYAMYMSGEQEKERQKLELKTTSGITANHAQSHAKLHSQLATGTGSETNIHNSKLKSILSDLTRLRSEKKMDGFLYYLYGVILKELKMVQGAIHAFVESVTLNPLLWCSWLEMVQILQNNVSTTTSGTSASYSHQHISVSPVEVFMILHKRFQQEYVSTRSHLDVVYEVMKDLFRAKLQVEGSFSQTGSTTTTTTIGDNAPATSSTFEQVLQDLLTLRNTYFPNSSYVLCELAVTHYHLQRFEKAQEFFSFIRKNDPYRYEHMHTFSNIFFIKGMKRELSVLSHELHKTHKYKPETCCVLGNYYSMRGEHERAVVYFRRALQLNPSFLSAWTLMGHEYVEMKNTTAAVSAYRTAVDIQPRDYRAWYGLGQTYEILSMPHYALYYYSKACALRPYDGRMWSALAGCYEALDMITDALRCYQRSRDNGEQTRALVKMGELYRKIDENDQAAFYFTQCLQLQRSDNNTGTGNGRVSTIMNEDMEAGILLFLTRYYMREAKPPQYELARTYCNTLVHQFPSYSQKDLAQQMLRELSSLK